MKFQASINGIKGTVQYRDEDVQKIFLPLLEKWKAMQERKGRRILVFLAAPPGTGKSTLLAFLRQLSCGEILPGAPSSEEQDRTPITTIGIDGFHHYQSFLDTHTTVRDGQEILMARVKGAPETFDRALLEERIRKIAAGEDCSWPDYDRTIENPRDDVFKIDASSKIVVLEGNYLLLDQPGWRDLRNYADYTMKLVADEKVLRERLLERRIRTGTPRPEAERFVDYSDMANARLVLRHSLDADLVLESGRDGFRIVNGDFSG
ncbi:MAG: nucleoside/nucleotide kinase family protein [Porcincola intestinalis]|uniref:nucleoside/nucleotide kinase family protein n=1 Tax=Porcincola intestinalis TaxID=2606632 RepID=UPI002A9146D7|nr:nucleoside/nucleotide kinase family protein [Porcincola intestinalis]MDY5332567.1 nucleoside/nucleotide kinase family protein [Porcincola intestinalis]